MNNFEFCNPVKVVFGKGSIARLSALLPEGSKVLVVYGGGSIKKNGIYEQVTAALKDFHTYEFGGIEANPRYEMRARRANISERCAAGAPPPPAPRSAGAAS